MDNNTFDAYKKQLKELIHTREGIRNDTIFDAINKLYQKSAHDYSNSKFYRYRPINKYTESEITKQEVFLAEIKSLDDVCDSMCFASNNKYEEFCDYEQRVYLNKLYRDNLRIACFTRKYNNIPMWKYYSDNYHGICIEYDVTNLRDKEIFLPIIYPYNEEYDKYSFVAKDDEEKFGAIATSIIKSKNWEFEDEWRIIRYRSTNNNLINIPIKTVILGPNIRADDKKNIIKWVDMINKNCEKRIKIKEIELTNIGLNLFDVDSIPDKHKYLRRLLQLN